MVLQRVTGAPMPMMQDNNSSTARVSAVCNASSEQCHTLMRPY